MTDPHLAAWLASLHQQGKSDHTIAAYRRAVQQFLRWNSETYGDETFEPKRVIPRDVRDWQAHQQTVEQAKPSTINQRLTALSRFYEWLIAQGAVERNPTAEVSTLKLPSRQPKALDEKSLRRLLRAVHAEGVKRDVAIIELLVGTGLRVSELLALTVGDVDLGARSGTVTVRRGKGGNYRVVPVPLEARKALDAYLADRPDRNNPQAPLWVGERGELGTRSAIKRILDKYALLAQLDGFGPHTLRHTFATRYLAANPHDLRGLAALLGHTSLDTVMIYTEPTVKELAARVERL